jgi:hypothetical protein
MILFRHVVPTKFQRFKIVYLCTMGCRLMTLLLFLIVHLSIICFIILKISLCSSQFGCSPFKIPRRLFFGAAARIAGSMARLKRDGTRAETGFRLSPKRTSPFKLAGASVQSAAGSRGVRISGSNAGYTMFRGSVRVLATHSIRQFPLHFPSRASPCAIRFQTHYTNTFFSMIWMDFNFQRVNWAAVSGSSAYAPK